jgi:NDP-sugar pyrophosphorylase family protein
VLDTQIPFGVVTLQGSYVEEIREKPVYRDYVNAGIYVIEPNILRIIPRMSRLDMPDLISQVVTDRTVLAFPLHESWIDLGRRSDLERAESELLYQPRGATTDEPDVD